MNLLKFLFLAGFLLLFSCDNEVEDKKGTVEPPLSPEPVFTTHQIDSSNHLTYSWLDNYSYEKNLINHISCPKGYKRVPVDKSSFADWLRHLPLKTEQKEVYLYNGDLKSNQTAHHSIVDIDVGKRDLQQCADAVMRLYAEYQYSSSDYKKIHFNFTSGDKVAFSDWMIGKKPVITGNTVSFSRPGTQKDDSYRNFRKYLDMIFSYAGTASLEKELKSVAPENIKIGDVFIQGGFPGHAVIVVDLAKNEAGEKVFLLAQSYMPAQEIHILNNFNDDVLNPWYSADFGGKLYTPEWTFNRNNLKRF